MTDLNQFIFDKSNEYKQWLFPIKNNIVLLFQTYLNELQLLFNKTSNVKISSNSSVQEYQLYNIRLEILQLEANVNYDFTSLLTSYSKDYRYFMNQLDKFEKQINIVDVGKFINQMNNRYENWIYRLNYYKFPSGDYAERFLIRVLKLSNQLDNLDVSIIFEAPITVMEEITPKKITELVQLEVNKIVQNVIKLNVEIPQNVENSKNDLINQLNNLSTKIDNLRSEIQVPTTSNSNDINRLIEQSVNDNVRELSRELRSQYNIFRKQIEETIKTDQSFVEENLEAFSQYTFDRDRIFKQINDLSGKIDEYESILGNLLVNEKIEEINQNIYLIAQKFDDKFKEVANDLRGLQKRDYGLQKPDYMDSEE